MQTLSEEEKQGLVEVINEQLGSDLTFDEFSDAVRGLFEDIPGFETIPPYKAIRHINQLWSQYHGQEHR
jgi:hypothetical protein